MNVGKSYLYVLLLLLLFSPITQSEPMSTNPLQSPQNLGSLVGTPSQDNPMDTSNILWPRIGNPAIVLNGSNLEILVKGPANISGWSIFLYREYLEYTIVFDSPIRNASTGVWHINALIASNSPMDLFDLKISITDEVSNYELVERNAVQIRNAFPTEFTLFHITDPHISTSVSEPNTRLLYALYQASAARADLVILTGDLVSESNVRSFEIFFDLIVQSSVPVFIGPGNHDIDSDRRGYTDYITHFGEDYYTANLGPDIFLTMTNSHVGELNSTQIEWIERDMVASNAQSKILCIHHSLPNLYYFNEAEALELIRICNETNVDIVLTGHAHGDRVDEVNGTLWITSTSIGAPPSLSGLGRNGFRAIEFQNGTPTSWNWTINKPWSQPWDSVMLTRHPLKYHDVDVGAYLSITNNLNYSINNQILDFLLQPISGIRHYIASGANVLSTVNGTNAFRIRVGVDLDAGESTTIRIFPNDAETPSLLSVSYPDSVLVGEEYVICANLTNPSSGLLDVHIDVVFDGELIGRYTMVSSDGLEWCTSLVHDTVGEIEFHIEANDYSGREFSSPIYTIECIAPEQPLDIVPFLLGSVGLVSVVFVVLYIIRRK